VWAKVRQIFFAWWVWAIVAIVALIYDNWGLAITTGLSTLASRSVPVCGPPEAVMTSLPAGPRPA
jgi:hypothetical protein